MRIFLSGGTGVVGRRLIPLLTTVGSEVTAVARSRVRADALERMGVAPAMVDLMDRRAIQEAVSGHTTVINLATHIPPSSQAFFPWAWRENDRIRTHASSNLVNAALEAGCERFIQESVSLIYPDSGERWITENSPVDPPSYARSVLRAESAAEHFTRAGRTGVVLRFALFYGWDSSHTLDTIGFVRKGIAPTFGHADSYVSSIATDDAASAVLAALNIPAGIYNVADDEPVRRSEYFASLARALDVSPPRLPPAWMRYLGGSVGKAIARSQRVSNARLKHEGNWAPRFRSVHEGWSNVCQHLKGAGPPPMHVE